MCNNPTQEDTVQNLEPHQYRLLNERAELRDRLEKLDLFIRSESFLMVPPPERDRLKRQANHMGEYLNVLNERVAAIEA